MVAPNPTSRRAARYRSRLRALGLRPVQLWLVDTRQPEVQERLRAELAMLRHHASTAEGDEFVELALADTADWGEP